MADPKNKVLDSGQLSSLGHNQPDDLSVPGQAYGYVFRSPYAHARILSLDVTEAKAQPGVLAVLFWPPAERAIGAVFQ